MSAKVIMVQGTMSNVGKSLLTAGLLRVFKQDGYRVAPFKSQNMALNSYVDKDGLEMGRAQAVQAQAAGIEPSVLMNPILLKPTTDMGSQVIVMGKATATMNAVDYFAKKKDYIPAIMEAYEKLASENDIIVIEGAGSPAEINLKNDDIVNMGLAKLVDSPVILVGDIDRGGVFAQLYGTLELLNDDEKDRVCGMIINKFRGDVEILKPGLEMIEEKAGKQVLGVVPYTQVDVEEEDSLGISDRTKADANLIDIAVIRLPKISNFTDFQSLSLSDKGSLRYVKNAKELGTPDIIILPGSKSVIDDAIWLKETGLFEKIKRMQSKGTPIFGICGGLQILGKTVTENDRTLEMMNLFSYETVEEKDKTLKQIEGNLSKCEGIWEPLSGISVKGYEIHNGRTFGVNQQSTSGDEQSKSNSDASGAASAENPYPVYTKDNIFATYLHGIFDSDEFRERFIRILCDEKGISYEDTDFDYEKYKEEQFDILADAIRENVDMKKIYEILGLEKGWITQPQDIERRSFEIIGQELGDIKLDPINEPVIKRVIHTSADFDYLENLTFSQDAVRKMQDAIRTGAIIVTDTEMAKAGINKKRLAQYGTEVLCFMADEEIAKIAKENGTTRAVASMDRAASLGKPVIFAVGNAPTALIRLTELINDKKLEPAGIIGVPVGFVNVVEAKELILDLDVPFIVARGRKGGSNIAAAIVNAIVYSME